MNLTPNVTSGGGLEAPARQPVIAPSSLERLDACHETRHLPTCQYLSAYHISLSRCTTKMNLPFYTTSSNLKLLKHVVLQSAWVTSRA